MSGDDHGSPLREFHDVFIDLRFDDQIKSRRWFIEEDERRLAKEFYPGSKDPEGDYRRDQDADESDVVSPGFSKEGW